MATKATTTKAASTTRSQKRPKRRSASASKRTPKKRVNRGKQEQLFDKHIPAVEKAAVALDEAQMERTSWQAKETDLRKKLNAVMKKHGVKKTYRFTNPNGSNPGDLLECVIPEPEEPMARCRRVSAKKKDT